MAKNPIGARARRGLAGLALVLGLASGVARADSAPEAAAAWERGDLAAARAIWQGLAAAGEGAAIFNLGVLADTPPDGAARDPVAALGQYRAAAAAGFMPAFYNIGVLLLEGDGEVAADRAAALEALREGARAGDILAQMRLGEVLSAPDAPEGAAGAAEGTEWFLRAAEAKYAPAQFAVSMAYALGRGVDVDLDLAALWAERAEVTQMMSGDIAYCTPESAALLARCRRQTPQY